MRTKKWLIMIISLALCLVPAASVMAFGEGASGPDVYAVQGMLKSLGSYAGKIDGKFGPVMKAGVMNFQRAYGLPVTGAVDQQTLQSILWAYGELKIQRAEPKPEPKPEPTPVPEPTPQPTPPQIPGLSVEEQRMVQLVNEERRKAGLSALQVDQELSSVARVKSKEMIEKDYFSHTSPTYGSPFEMMKKFGIQYRSAGENIACNQSVDAAHKALMESPGHRENILNASFTHIGIGIVDGGICGKMFTQMFIGK